MKIERVIEIFENELKCREQLFRVMAEMWGHEKAAEKFEELMIKEEQEREDEN